MVAPLVRELLRRTPKRLPRSAATGIVFAALVLVIGFMVAIAGPRVAEQSGRS
jgi:predicted PurR-regulated permease PerM